MKFLVCLLILLTCLSTVAAQDAKIGQVIPRGDWSGRLEINQPELDSRFASRVDGAALKLQWAIVSGGQGQSVDRVKVRVLFDGGTLIDLYKRKNGFNYDWNQVVLHKATGTKGQDSDKLPDLRIAHWDHNELVIAFTTEKNDDRPSIQHYWFDLSGGKTQPVRLLSN